MRKTLTQFAICVVLLLLLATPVFYWLTKSFYAEDMIEVVEAVEKGQPVPALDMEEDIAEGIVLQFFLITAVVGVACVVVMRFISKRLWTPFDTTLKSIENFRLESATVPYLPESDIREFTSLNRSLRELIERCIDSYRIQKEFTENASHEMQTPLAVFQSKLDLLLQQPNLTAEQAAIIQDLSLSTSRLARLNRNLLLLAKMENRQFQMTEAVDVVDVVKELLPSFEVLTEASPTALRTHFDVEHLEVKANRPLLESLVNNLVVNAIRHSELRGNGLQAADVVEKESEIIITISGAAIGSLETAAPTFVVSNIATGGALDATHIFERFYRPAGQTTGNGLGLAIVKSVCDYHGWHVTYSFEGGRHVFTVKF